MNRERVSVGSGMVLTLRELLRPNLRAVLVGINPSPTSVAAGHYYQGRLGKRMWSRMESAGIVRGLVMGAEDDTAFQQGIGFADVVRRPTSTSEEVSRVELAAGAATLSDRLEIAQGAIVVFVFKRGFDAAGTLMVNSGWSIDRMPGPYAPRSEVENAMARLAQRLKGQAR